MSLFDLIAAGDGEGLREALEANPELAGERNDAGLSLVLFALSHGRSDLVEPILDANPPLDVFDAAAVGRTRGLEELLEADPALVASRSPDGATPLELALRFGQEDAAKILRERGATPPG